ncbi:MAG: SDR family NAD(P)-dependent oxidoreductase [Planctomycetes bacterium]|nr:SDR family NAD(P)-dependent oxidoreductase [Planctomycetota bacterium]
MDLELAGRVAIVGGASQGIGRATALTLAAEGCDVVMAARREDVLSEAAAEADKTGAQVLAVPAEVRGKIVRCSQCGAKVRVPMAKSGESSARTSREVRE